MTGCEIQKSDHRIVYRAKDEPLVVRPDILAYEFLFLQLGEFKLAGAEVQEIRFAADGLKLVENSPSAVPGDLADQQR